MLSAHYFIDAVKSACETDEWLDKHTIKARENFLSEKDAKKAGKADFFCSEICSVRTHCPIPFDKEAMDEIRAELQKDYIDGITLSGGDPLFPGNRGAVTRLLQTIREEFPNKTIWLYTGYSYE